MNKTLIWIWYFLKYTFLCMLAINVLIHVTALLISFVKLENMFYLLWVDEYSETMASLRGMLLLSMVVGAIGGTHDTNLYFRKKEKNG